MRSIRHFVLAFACVLAFAAVASAAEQIDNPQYKKWSAYKPGTWVKYKQVADAAGQKTETEITTKLAEVTPEKLVLEMTTSMTMGGQKMDMPPQKMEVAAKIDKPATGDATATAKPEVKEGTDEVTVGGKTYKCKTMETTTKQGQMTIWSKTWMSDDVPQGMVKMQSKTEGAMKMNSEMELVGFEIVK